MKNEREVTVDTLLEITQDSSYNNIALRNALIKNRDLTDSQRGFVTEAVNGTLRNLLLIDYIIDHFSKTKTTRMRPFILSVLRAAAYQIKFMRSPARAVVDESVKLCHKRGFSSLSGFVNGILRSIAANPNGATFPDERENAVKYLSVMYSFPEWIITYWLETMDYVTVKAMCQSLNERPRLSLCVNTLKTTPTGLELILHEELSSARRGLLSENALTVESISDMTRKESFKQGLYYVMDEAAMKAVEVLNPAPGSLVLDVCAAPGGKSMYAAMLMKGEGRILACDIHRHKLKLMEDSLRRLGINNIELLLADAANAHYPFEADYCIVDAPCSGLGLVRRKPDIKYARAPGDLESLISLQKSILSNAVKYVKKGGTLVYSTCTVSHRENQDITQWFAENHSCNLSEELTLPPHLYGADGFYIARFIKEG